MATRSLRCVAIAYRTCEMDKVPTTEEELENWQLPEGDLILLAIVGIKVRMAFLALIQCWLNSSSNMSGSLVSCNYAIKVSLYYP